jgi:lambda family phage tail tape measure protein
MAESVARVKILAQIEGLEGFDKLKGAFKGLQQAIGPAESELAKARQQILEFGKAGEKTEQVIKGQIDALKALQGQASISGTVYRQLGKDIQELSGVYKEAATGVKQFTDAQLKSQIVGSKPNVFDKQIAALRRGLQGIKVYTREYTDALTEIERRRLPFDAAVGRQGVIAAAEAYSQGGKGGAALPELPNTTAGLNQRMSELAKELDNVARGGERWIQVQREMSRLQRELAYQPKSPEVRAALDRLSQSRGINSRSGFLAFSQGAEQRVDEAARREQERRQALYDKPLDRPRPPSELFQSIAGISNQTASNQLQLMERSYREVADSIRQASSASDGSLSSLQRQRAAWEQLRATIGPLDKEYAQIEMQARKAIGVLDRQIGRQQIGGRGGAGQVGQGLGALAASGIFGGPEGFLGSAGGAAIGGLLGGPAGFATGSFIGGSVGAYGGMFRQSLAGLSTYAADIGKLEIALKGITKTQEEYERALAASASVTRDFNVPQLEATRGMTQLSAAVIGAGGRVADAEVVFRNVTAAIKASGGSAEDVQGALTALGQIFSKGKVSAEELQGQLGERLPGAVTMFAQATGRTLPQLQKDLEQGVVGLSDLMKFITSDQGLGQFEQRAKDVAQSSADAGARLTATWNDTKRAIGEALLPLGAQIQDSLGRALKEATPALVEIAKGLASFINLIVSNADVIGSLAAQVIKLGVTFAGAGFAIKAFGALMGPIRGGLALLGAAFGTTTAQAVVAQQKLTAFGLRAKAIAASLAAPIVVTVAIVGAEIVWNWISKIKEARDRLKSASTDLRGEAWVKSIGGAAKDTASLQKEVSAAGRAYQLAADKIKAYKKEQATTPFKPRQEFLAEQIAAEEAVLKVAESRYKAGIEELANRKPTPKTSLTDFATTTPKGDLDREALDKLQRDRDAEALRQQQYNETVAKNRIALDDAVHQNAMELIRKRYEYEQELISKQRDNWVKSQTGGARTVAGIVSQFLGEIDQLQGRMAQAQQKVIDATQELKSAQAMAAVTTSSIPAAVGGRTSGGVANMLPGTRGGPNINEGVGYGRGRLHAGQDLGLDVGDPIHARMAGEIIKAYRTGFGDAGGAVVIRYEDGRQGTYGHTLPSVRQGQMVAAGQKIATVAPDGQNTHLHYELRDQMGRLLNPLNAIKESLRVPAGQTKGAGLAAAARRDVSAEGSANVAAEEVKAANEAAKLTVEQLSKLTPETVKGFVFDLTDDLRQQNAAMQDSASIIALRNKLQLDGVRPEVIESEVKKAEAVQANNQALGVLTPLLNAAKAKLDELNAANKGNTDEAKAAQMQVDAYSKGIADLNTNLSENTRLTNEATAAQIAFNDAMRFRQDTRIGEGFKEGVQDYVESIGTMRKATAELAVSGIKGVEDAILSLVTTGTANFRQFAADILTQTARMIIQQMVLRTIFQGLGFFGNGGVVGGASTNFTPGVVSSGMEWSFAKGGAFAKNGIQPFATGGVVTRPTLFKFASGGTMRTGLMGEAGPEAIMPLRRGRDGKLGVAGSGGGGNVTVNVSVDASGSKVQGDSSQGEQLGRAVSRAVQDELLRQKRPGGLLA